MKFEIDRSLLVAALAAYASAQSTMTVINDPSDPALTTVYYSVCPTAATTTITLPSTITMCPGPGCNGGEPTITPPPNHDGAYTSTVLQITFTGTNGKVTELNEYVTVYDAPCPNGPGMCQATYTVTEECPCHTRNPDVLPTGFTTTVHVCSACGPDNGEATITQTVPCSTGPYATVTPTIGPSPAAGANGASAGAGANGAAGAGAVAGNGATAAGASAGAAAGASAAANAPGSAGANAGAGSSSNAVAGANGAAAGAGMGGAGMGSAGNMAAPAGNGTMSAPMAGYTGAAEKTAFAFSTFFIGVLGSLAWML
jgi:hypothetical protein